MGRFDDKFSRRVSFRLKEKVMSTAKEEVKSLLSKLPDDCSLEDIQYHLYVLEKVRHGLEVADNQGTLTQEEVEGQLSKWLTK
jgi:hypothetical protein